MTDRHSQITVILKQDTRSDDVEDIIRLIRQIGAVADAVPGPMVSAANVERIRARIELRKRMFDLVDDVLKV